MRVDVVTLFPEMIAQASRFGVTGKAIEKGIVVLELWNPRDYTTDKRRTVDARPYGGGPGMVMMVKPLRQAIETAKAADPRPVRVAYLSPQGVALKQADFIRFSTRERILMIAGRYEGVDQRLLDTDVDEEWSLGDYVISGGELAALVVLDGLTRLLSNVLGADESSRKESFMEGLLDYPQFTRPATIEAQAVPSVLQSGDHAQIARWRLKQSLGRTMLRRPELLDRLELNDEHKILLNEFIKEEITVKRNKQ
ncbi:MAG: tRNA (guanosine(37)-N1)-methyltransferase TrmD [Methylococcaceae bacterium]|nr:tRNA (guanosine(37)-N1)-methyltransferase TrmD [Methylococcaceae bacterium]